MYSLAVDFILATYAGLVANIPGALTPRDMNAGLNTVPVHLLITDHYTNTIMTTDDILSVNGLFKLLVVMICKPNQQSSHYNTIIF